jgi:hypothetical protein
MLRPPEQPRIAVADSRIASAATPKPAKARCRIVAARLPRDFDPGCAQNPFHYTKRGVIIPSYAPQRVPYGEYRLEW